MAAAGNRIKFDLTMNYFHDLTRPCYQRANRPCVVLLLISIIKEDIKNTGYIDTHTHTYI
jgi:hypothetical protein